MGRLYIYPHEWLIFMVNVGKYTSPMDPMRTKKICNHLFMKEILNHICLLGYLGYVPRVCWNFLRVIEFSPRTTDVCVWIIEVVLRWVEIDCLCMRFHKCGQVLFYSILCRKMTPFSSLLSNELEGMFKTAEGGDVRLEPLIMESSLFETHKRLSSPVDGPLSYTGWYSL